MFLSNTNSKVCPQTDIVWPLKREMGELFPRIGNIYASPEGVEILRKVAIPL